MPTSLPPSHDDPSQRRLRGTPVRRTGLLLMALIAGCLSMGYAIFWLLSAGRH